MTRTIRNRHGSMGAAADRFYGLVWGPGYFHPDGTFTLDGIHDGRRVFILITDTAITITLPEGLTHSARRSRYPKTHDQ